MSDDKANAFFDRADQIAETGNWDYAIEMYLQGIGRDPENIDRGHEKLREIAVARKANKGKGPGFLDSMKRKATKDPIESLINAEWLMSRDPANAAYWRQIIAAALAGQFKAVLEWAGKVLFEVNRTAKKPRKDVYAFLTQSLAQGQVYSLAVRACQAAIELAPDDAQLQEALRDLSAQDTMQKGKYDEGAKFTESVKDMKGQIDLLKKDQLSQDRNFMDEQVVRTRTEYEAEPAVPGKITAFVDALTRTDDESYENEAVAVLEKAHRESGTYRWKVRLGDIKMRQMTRRYQKLLKAGDRAAATEQARQQLAFELDEFTDRAANYPTDLGLRFELGKRQYIAGLYDDAIGSLQQARRDAKRRLHALNYLGQAFLKKDWLTEAAETFEQALQGDVTESWQKDLRYNLGTTYRQMDRLTEAVDQFSAVAQIDYNYKDVRDVIDDLRKRQAEGGEEK